MFIYSYTALLNDNSIIRDTIVSKNKKYAYFEILELRQTPIKITLNAIFILNSKNIDYRIHFFHQLSTLVSSGISLLQCLNILNENCHLPFWKKLIFTAIRDLEQGNNLTDSLKKQPIIFNNTIISLIKIAENTGQYEDNFHIIVEILENQKKTNQHIRKALRYPITLLCFSTILIYIMLIFVLPQFKSVYESFQQELPILTKWMIYLSNSLINHLSTIVLLISFILIFCFKFKQHLSILFSKFIHFIPLVNRLIKLSNINIYFLTLYSTLQAGLNLNECLKCTTKAIHNPIFNKETIIIHDSVIRGNSLSNAVKNSQLFPKIAAQLLSIAEESGQLPHFTKYLFDYFSEQYVLQTDKTLKNLEPILLLCMAFIVGTLMLAMYLPIFNLGNVITGI